MSKNEFKIKIWWIVYKILKFTPWYGWRAIFLDSKSWKKDLLIFVFMGALSNFHNIFMRTGLYKIPHEGCFIFEIRNVKRRWLIFILPALYHVWSRKYLEKSLKLAFRHKIQLLFTYTIISHFVCACVCDMGQTRVKKCSPTFWRRDGDLRSEWLSIF